MQSTIISLLCFSLMSWKALGLSDVIFIIDGSGSINSADFILQKTGFELALRNTENVPTGAGKAHVKVGVVQFSGYARTEISPRLLETDADVNAMASEISAISQIRGATHPGDGIVQASSDFGSTYRPGVNQTMCLSTDGMLNGGVSLSSAVSSAKSAAYELEKFSVVAIIDGSLTDDDFQQEYGPHVFGPGSSVTVASRAAEFASIVADACFSEGLSVEVVGVEAVQVSQTLTNTVPLIRKKRTMVRVHAQTFDGSSESIQVRLHVKDSSGNDLGSPLTAINNNIKVPIQGAVLDRRATLSSTINFELDETLTDRSRLIIEPRGLGVSLDCTTIGSCATTLNFDQGHVVDITLVMTAVNMPNNGKATFGEATTAVKKDIKQRLQSIMPTAKINMKYDTITCDSREYETNKYGLYNEDILRALKEKRDNDMRNQGTPDSKRWYYALVPESVHVYFDYGGTVYALFGEAHPTDPLAMGKYWTPKTDGYHTTSHELGHVMDILHPISTNGYGYDGVCGEGGGTGAVAFPYVEGNFPPHGGTGAPFRYTLGPLTLGKNQEVWGWDSYNNKIMDPRVHFELMSYCNSANDEWISDVTYTSMKSYLANTFSTARRLSEEDDALVSSRAIRSYNMYVIRIENGVTVSLLPAKKITAESSYVINPPSGTYTLKLYNSAQQEVSSISFTPASDRVYRANQNAISFTYIYVIDSVVAASARVIDPNSAVATNVVASANAPVVQVVYPNGGESLFGEEVFSWAASDADNDPLTFDVFLSYDNGATFTLLAGNIGDRSYAVNTSDLAETSVGLLRVQASDGFNVAQDVSASTFITPNNPPTAIILTPALNFQFVGVQTISFSCSAEDVEDGELNGNSVRWTSDVDGHLGYGNTLSLGAYQLTAAIHTITVTVTDSNSVSATDTTSFSVDTTIAPVGPPTESPTSAPTRNPTIAPTPRVTSAPTYTPVELKVWEGGTNSPTLGVAYRFTGLDPTRYTSAVTVEVYATDFEDMTEYVTGIFAGLMSLSWNCNPGEDSGDHFYTCVSQVDVTDEVVSGYLDVISYASTDVNENPYLGYTFYVRYTLEQTPIAGEEEPGFPFYMVVIIFMVIVFVMIMAAGAYFYQHLQQEKAEGKYGAAGVEVPSAEDRDIEVPPTTSTPLPPASTPLPPLPPRPLSRPRPSMVKLEEERQEETKSENSDSYLDLGSMNSPLPPVLTSETDSMEVSLPPPPPPSYEDASRL